MRSFRINFQSVLFVALLSCFVFISSNTVYAVAGCDPAKMQQLQDRSLLKRAAWVGSNEQQTDKAESVHVLTCSPEAFQISAQEGGAIFSGDFSTELNNVIGPVMDELLSNFIGSFMESVLGSLGGILGGFGGTLLGGLFGGSFSCDNMQDLWNGVMLESIDPLSSVGDMDWILDVAQGIITTGGNMDPNLNNPTIAGAAANVRAAITAPPIPIPNYVGAATTCAVLTLAQGAPPPGCP